MGSVGPIINLMPTFVSVIKEYFFVTEDDVQKIVSVSIDGKESKLIFIDHAYSEMSVRYLLQSPLMIQMAKNSLTSQCENPRNFPPTQFLIDTTRDLRDRKIQEFPHCGYFTSI